MRKYQLWNSQASLSSFLSFFLSSPFRHAGIRTNTGNQLTVTQNGSMQLTSVCHANALKKVEQICQSAMKRTKQPEC